MLDIGLGAKVVRVVVVLGVVVVVVADVVGGRKRVTVVIGRTVVVVVGVVVCTGDNDGELGRSTDDGVDRFVQLFHQEYLEEIDYTDCSIFLKSDVPICLT